MPRQSLPHSIGSKYDLNNNNITFLNQLGNPNVADAFTTFFK